MPKTTVVNVGKGATCDVYIGRAQHHDDGYFGNPFMILEAGKAARFDAIEKFRQYFLERIEKDAAFKTRVEELRGKRLGCFCAPAPCHGNVYIAYLEGWDMSDNLLHSMSEEDPEQLPLPADNVCRDCGTSENLTVTGGDLAENERLCSACLDKLIAEDETPPWEEVPESDPYQVDGRLEHDAYYTPESFVTELLARVPYIGGVVLEPCAGDGAISRVLEAYTPPLPEPIEVWTNDINPQAGEHDFYFDAVLPAVFEQVQPDWVVTNPPYKSDILPEIVKNALEFAHVGVAMLLRLSFLEPTIERNSWFVENPPDLLIVTPRFSFKRNGKTDSVTTAWFVWYNQERAPAADWRVQGNSMAWPKGIQIMPRSVLDGVN